MGSIVLLDEHTINKIAAGEVVDRPASIVKELVENSIDAGATNIEVEIKKGGISYIKITDNGLGIAKDDVEIAFERHATSKIRQEEDLHKITSMGFRGEALASIAAIAKVNMITKRKEEPVATHIKVESGVVQSIEQVAGNMGTTIIIQDVFHNVPARYKFLKKDHTEAGYIEDVVTRIAMVNPNISFKYINNSKTIFQTSGDNDIKKVVYNIFGKDIYNSILEVEYEFENIRVSGVVGLPKISRSTRIHQFTYINSRYVKNKTITAAIDKAYAQKLEINKFAFGIINITMNPEFIDVNVHPAKLEVKFSNESQVFEAVYYAIKSTLENYNRKTSPFSNFKYNHDELVETKINNIPSNVIENKANVTIKSYDFDNTPTPKNIASNLKVLENLKHNKPVNVVNAIQDSSKNANYIEANNIIDDKLNTSYKEEISKEIINENTLKMEIDLTNIDSNEIKLAEEDFNSNIYQNLGQEEIKLETNGIKHPYRYIGSVFDTYILIQIQDTMYIIDQHAAHERLLYEQIKQNYYAKDRQSQMLMVPILIEGTSKEMKAIEENITVFEKIGYVMENFGGNTIKILGVPNLGYDVDFKAMFMDVVDEVLGANRTNTQDKEARFLYTVACKAAVKGNMRLSAKEHINLIDDMMRLDNPFTCPHGRPTAQEITKKEIEKKFLRK